MFIANIPVTQFSYEITKSPIIYIPPKNHIVVGHRQGRVFVKMGLKIAFLDVVTAHKVALDIQRKMNNIDSDEIVRIYINGESIDLLKQAASLVSAKILLKCDDADDWQLKFNRRKTQ